MEGLPSWDNTGGRGEALNEVYMLPHYDIPFTCSFLLFIEYLSRLTFTPRPWRIQNMTLVIFKDKEIPLYSSWYGLNGWRFLKPCPPGLFREKLWIA